MTVKEQGFEAVFGKLSRSGRHGFSPAHGA
jgi:hypothetical protein